MAMGNTNRVLIACLFLAAIAGILYGNRLYAVSFFANELANAHTYETVTIGNATYVVDDGLITLDGKSVSGWHAFEALSLAYEKVLAERSPILGLPGVAPEKLLSALSLLKDEQGRLSLSQKDSVNTDLVNTSLYPIQFLKSAASLEQARQTFITTGNATDAVHYRSLLQSTLYTYQRDLQGFRSAFQTVVSSTTPTYGTDTYIIDYSGIERAFTMLEDGSNKMKNALRMRTFCTHGITIACDPGALYLPEIKNVRQEATVNSPLTQEVIALYKAAGFPLNNEPSVTLSSSSCIPRNAPPTFSFIRYGTSAADQYLTPLFTGDILFIKSALYGSTPFYQYFEDNGINYVPVDPLTYYECPDASREFASALSVLEIIRFAKKYDVSDYIAASDMETIASLRNRLLGPMVYERDASTYISALRRALPSTKETASLHRMLDELALALWYKTAGLTQLISTIVQFEGGNRLIAGRGVAFDTSARNLFYIRSGFGSLFLITSPSVANPTTSPFRTNTMTKSEKPYVQYSEIKSTPGIVSTIQKDMGFFWKAHIHL